MARRKKKTVDEPKVDETDSIEAAPVIEIGEEDLDEIGDHDTVPPPAPEPTPPPVDEVYPPPSVTGSILQTEDEIRQHVIAVCEALLPSGVGDAPFEWMTQGRSLAAKKVRKYFSTCGELVMAVLYCLGYRGPVLNRELTSLDDGMKRAYQYGQNMAWIFGGARGRRSAQEGLWVKARAGHNSPSRGDILFVSNGPPRTEHVSVFVDVVSRGPGTDETWSVWQAGGGGVLDQRGGFSDDVRMSLYGRGKVIVRLNDRQLHGWIDVGKLVGKLSKPALLPTF